MKQIFLALALFLFFWQSLSVGIRLAAILKKAPSLPIYGWQTVIIGITLTYFVMYVVLWR